MLDLTDKNDLIGYLKSHGLYAKHSLGQNFLVDREALDKIVGAAELGKPHPSSPSKEEELVVEVGPGIGTLTGELVKKAGKVIAVELDEKLAELLAEQNNTVISTSHSVILSETKDLSATTSRDSSAQPQNDKLLIFNADILKVNIPDLVGEKPYKVVANIPYYITSKILKLFLTLPQKPESIVMLVQKEVAERICAKPGDMSILAISVQAYGEPEIVGIVPKESFFPAPKIDSAILRISNINPFCHSRLLFCHSREGGNPGEIGFMNPRVPLSENTAGPEDDTILLADDNADEKKFFQIVHMGFAARRKTLSNNIASGLHIDKKAAVDIIKSIGLKENVRAQELSLDQWGKLARQITDKVQNRCKM